MFSEIKKIIKIKVLIPPEHIIYTVPNVHPVYWVFDKSKV